MSQAVPLATHRAMLAGGAAVPLLIGLDRIAFAGPPPVLKRYADMHVHLFNGHDLPVGMFMVEVLFRNAELPRALKFIIDFRLRRAQDLALSAEAERRRLTPGAAAVPIPDYNPEAFGADLAAWGREKAFKSTEGGDKLFSDDDLSAGYEELVAAAIADAQGTTIAAVEKQAGPGKPKLSEGLSAQRAFADLARRAESELRVGPGEKLIANAASPMAAPGAAPLDCSEVCPEHSYDMSFRAVLRYVG